MKRQQTLFERLDKILGYGEQQSISRLRQYCSLRRDDLEQGKEQDLGWTGEHPDAKRDELKIMRMKLSSGSANLAQALRGRTAVISKSNSVAQSRASEAERSTSCTSCVRVGKEPH
ncbi:hypothetical protein BGZ97_004672 [Linnemannia gamsii]|uniref:Uncharacterized protein n=1 Tax=Linnemannia gamsii TaxID=64522 RepID=A0A9P6RHJ9_9FUNG|nr:hypothetical protein BGZ97_004672 [Linnemannia gamsii]